MDVVANNYLPGDSRLIDQIVYELKSQGIFDNFRKDCISDVDTKPAYQNLRQRVEGCVFGFLKDKGWSPDLNKNQVREQLRKNIYDCTGTRIRKVLKFTAHLDFFTKPADSFCGRLVPQIRHPDFSVENIAIKNVIPHSFSTGFLEIGLERIVDQVVNPKINSIFLPKIEDVVYGFLGIEKPERPPVKKELNINVFDLLPKDLEAISPESDHGDTKDDSDDSLDVTQSFDVKIDEYKADESMVMDTSLFIPPEEASADSNLSGFSGLQSHESCHSSPDFTATQMEQLSNQEPLLTLSSANQSCEDVSMESNLEGEEHSKSQEIKPEVSSEENTLETAEINKTEAAEEVKKEIEVKNIEEEKKVDKVIKNESSSSSKKENDKYKSHSHKSSSHDKDRKYSSKDKEKNGSSTAKNKYKSVSSKSKDKDISRRGKDNDSGSRDKDSRNRDKGKDSGNRDKNKDTSNRDKDKDSGNKDKESSNKDKDSSSKGRDKDSSKDRDKNKERGTIKGTDIHKESRSNSSSSSKREQMFKNHESHSHKSRDKSDKPKVSSKSEKDRKDSKEKDKDRSKLKHSSSSGNSKSSSSKKEHSNNEKESKSHSSLKSSSKKSSSSKSKSKSLNNNDETHKKNHVQSDSKKNKDRKSNDDHYSAKEKKTDRRSTDRDSNDGSSSSKRNNSSKETFTSSKKDNREISKHSDSGTSGDSGNSESLENKGETSIETNESKTSSPQIKYIKPKFASNIHEARKLMKIRKQLAKLERQNQRDLDEIETTKFGDAVQESDDIKEKSHPVSPVKDTDNSSSTDPSNEDLVKGTDMSKESWEAFEKRLALEMSRVNTSYCYPDDDFEDVEMTPNLAVFSPIKATKESEYHSKTPEDTRNKAKKIIEELKPKNCDLEHKSKSLEVEKPSIDSTIVANGEIESNNSNREWCTYLEKPLSKMATDLSFLNSFISKMEEDIEKLRPKLKNNLPKMNILEVRLERKRKLDEVIQVNLPQMDQNKEAGNNVSFPFPLSPAESDKSGEANKEPQCAVPEKRKRQAKASVAKRYSTEELYKPRPVLSASRRRGIKH